jgi:hypothetical protein
MTNLVSTQLLAGFIVAVLLLACSHVLHFKLAYSHVLSSDEKNVSLLELFHQICVQAKLAQSIFPLNIEQAHE